MRAQTIKQTDFVFPGQTRLYHGKVRDMYDIGDKYILAVSTDRISAFDVILPRQIPHKGAVLNQVAAHFLKEASSVVPNWLIDTPDPNVSLGYKFEPVKIEVIVRGILVGSAWRSYQNGSREICGVKIPDGLKEYDAFPEPIITPTTKAEEGHDEDITGGGLEIIKLGLAAEQEWDKICDYALKLFAKGQGMAAARGLLLADTKYEFGRKDGEIRLIDEVHTADSSRYFYKDSYDTYLKNREGERPKQLSKEFVREWLMEHGFSGQHGQTVPELPDEFIDEISRRYIELYEILTGRKFQPPDAAENILERIETNTKNALEKLK